MRVEIDPKSGFCFGVVRAISEAERAIESGGKIYSLGDIVHNRIEVMRLEELGLGCIERDQIEESNWERVLIRAHGEPPTTYSRAKAMGFEIIDATCPVVAKLQDRVREAYSQMQKVGGQVVLLGKRGHAEVVGLTGQVNDDVVVIEKSEDLALIDFQRPIYFLSQTTQSVALFESLAAEMRTRIGAEGSLSLHDSICRQVASREEHLREFVAKFDVVIFVCGKKSSNGKVLFEVCRRANPRTYNIEEPSEVDAEWFDSAEAVGVCGATSTPAWLMESVAERIKNLK